MSSTNPDEIGALWVKQGKNGEFLAGTIGGVSVVAFRNDRKVGQQPDYRVLKAREKNGPREHATVSTPPDPDDPMPFTWFLALLAPLLGVLLT